MSEYESLKTQKDRIVTKDRMRDIATALKQVDPVNWITRLREFNRETDPPRLDTDELNRIITDLVVPPR